jgi:phosphoenolpyruvate---glycerone phosphotransferase subunit DhaL
MSRGRAEAAPSGAGVPARRAGRPAGMSVRAGHDALVPARDELAAAIRAGVPMTDALSRAADAAERGRDATKPLVVRKGRASYLGERSAGHVDPGAVSSSLLLRCAATAFADRPDQ